MLSQACFGENEHAGLTCVRNSSSSALVLNIHVRTPAAVAETSRTANTRALEYATALSSLLAISSSFVGGPLVELPVTLVPVVELPLPSS